MIEGTVAAGEMASINARGDHHGCTSSPWKNHPEGTSAAGERWRARLTTATSRIDAMQIIFYKPEMGRVDLDGDAAQLKGQLTRSPTT